MRKPELVNVPGFGEVWALPLALADLRYVRLNGKRDPLGTAQRIAYRLLCDENGNRLFESEGEAGDEVTMEMASALLLHMTQRAQAETPADPLAISPSPSRRNGASASRKPRKKPATMKSGGG